MIARPPVRARPALLALVAAVLALATPAAARDNAAVLARAIAAIEKRDLATAETALRPLADADPEAAAWLGTALARLGTTATLGEAMILLRAAAATGNARANYELAFQTLAGVGARRDEADAARLFRLAAEAGLARAAYNLGVLHRAGRGVPVNPTEATAWFERAAKAGDPYGAHAFARDIELSPQAPARATETAALYRMAAIAGHGPAAIRYGLALAEGRGVARDRKAAEAWLRHALECGYAEAALFLGDLAAPAAMQRDGKPAQAAARVAVDWYRQAAEAGIATAQVKLAGASFAGAGVDRDFPTALIWYRRAADQGTAEAQYVLGVWWSGGVVGPIDTVEGHKWLLLAERQGHANATKVRLKALETLSAADLRRAEAAANAFRPRLERVGRPDDEAGPLQPPKKIP